ncbi:hypothetical protein HMPREF9554_00495, partial [Treponema phagedenis F0421]
MPTLSVLILFIDKRSQKKQVFSSFSKFFLYKLQDTHIRVLRFEAYRKPALLYRMPEPSSYKPPAELRAPLSLRLFLRYF